MYLLIPDISRWQWHPFTISQQSASGMLTVRIKRFGSWTERLLHQLKLREPMAIRASCPPASGPHAWRQDDVVVVLAGGIAVRWSTARGGRGGGRLLRGGMLGRCTWDPGVQGRVHDGRAFLLLQPHLCTAADSINPPTPPKKTT